MHLAELLEFVYPLGAEHPKVGPRLFPFALYGPLREGWLWGGPWNNKKRLEEWQIATMLTVVEREDNELLRCLAS